MTPESIGNGVGLKRQGIAPPPFPPAQHYSKKMAFIHSLFTFIGDTGLSGRGPVVN